MNHDYEAEHPSSEASELLEAGFHHLELWAVLEEVALHARSQPGREAVLRAAPSMEQAVFTAGLRLVAELKELARLNEEFPMGRLPPLEGVIERLLSPGFLLETDELLAIAQVLDLADTVSTRISSLNERHEALRALAACVHPVSFLRERIAMTFDEHGLVRSTASRRLAEIRDSGVSARRRITTILEGIIRDRRLSDVVQEDYVTLRNDRYVILLKPDFKGHIEGIVHDHSRSRASVYVEPFEVIEINNRAAALLEEEREEIHRILRALTEEVRDALPLLRETYDSLADLDAFQARALYALSINAIAPEMSLLGFSIKGGRHPLLLASLESPVIPMDIVQDQATSALVISGPNMGGKTVALKMAGLFPLMVRSSLMIPAEEGTVIMPFSRIMADIGDEQDVRGRLSSFSGHATRIRDILDFAGPGDLVLLDELGGATDPAEGAALAMAVLDEMMRIGLRVVVTTHLTQLKAYAFGREGVRNVSAQFHPVTMKPTYKLVYDLPGESHAIRTAESIGMPDSVISAARRYLDPSGMGAADLIAGLRRRIADTDRVREDLERKVEELDREIKGAQEERERLTFRFQGEAGALIRDAERDIAGLMKSLKLQGKKPPSNPVVSLSEVKRRLEVVLGTPTARSNPAAQVGAVVAVRRIGKQGRVSAVLEGLQLEIMVGAMKVRADVNEVDLIQPAQDQKTSSKKGEVSIEIPGAAPVSQLNVIGLRVEEALPLIDKALDGAMLAGLPSFAVIHGKGTGRLGQAIKEHLQRSVYVKGVQAADPRMGGPGVTIVDLQVD